MSDENKIFLDELKDRLEKDLPIIVNKIECSIWIEGNHTVMNGMPDIISYKICFDYICGGSVKLKTLRVLVNSKFNEGFDWLCNYIEAQMRRSME